MTAGRPSLAETITALTLTHPQMGKLHTDEEADIAEVLRHIDTEHQGADEADNGGGYLDNWGICSTCRTTWPCTEWTDAQQLGLLYLGRAQDRVAAHARQVLDRLAERDRQDRRPA